MYPSAQWHVPCRKLCTIWNQEHVRQQRRVSKPRREQRVIAESRTRWYIWHEEEIRIRLNLRENWSSPWEDKYSLNQRYLVGRSYLKAIPLEVPKWIAKKWIWTWDVIEKQISKCQCNSGLCCDREVGGDTSSHNTQVTALGRKH